MKKEQMIKLLPYINENNSFRLSGDTAFTIEKDSGNIISIKEWIYENNKNKFIELEEMNKKDKIKIFLARKQFINEYFEVMGKRCFTKEELMNEIENDTIAANSIIEASEYYGIYIREAFFLGKLVLI